MQRPARTLPLLFALVLLSLTTACGVAFHETFDGTEVFKSISLNGDRAPDSQLTVNLTVAQTYPVPVTVACYYDNEDKLTDDDYRVAFQERATQIGQVVMPPAKEPIRRQLITFDFSVKEPGNYFLACLTPASADNGLGLPFKIESSSSASAPK